MEIHLSALKRQGLIDTWHDRRIGAGEEIDHVISEHLEKADIILLLVSPYFIASDYCYDVEMKRAIERQKAGEARVLPVILHPCDWHSLPFGKLMATPTDGKPVSMFPNQHAAFLEISQAIRKAAEEVNAKSYGGSSAKSTVQVAPDRKVDSEPQIRSSNLRVKKKYADIEKDRFLNDAFEYIAKYFEGSLSELRSRNNDVESDFRRIDANHFVAAVYMNGSETSRCKIWLADRRSFPGGIAYSVGNSPGDSSYNESISVDDDGYILFLKPLGMAFRGRVENEKMGFEGAAEYLWGMFIEPLQR
ncbi:MAG: toll/interleukin-1 receptor domain-containing protein [Nitrospirae bacterium]|nr:toll/interleukin-1 receptor domain-containing protein [Nitrospirota bacterium]